ncbi:MAG: hypothetical protein KJO36_13425 [Acidimicrobiia bacterium]|nr:hypothetical protein [Acidimicrobiia bacterium]NNC43165.1 hypothetical protein [Acidimicrobiia bacterium]
MNRPLADVSEATPVFVVNDRFAFSTNPEDLVAASVHVDGQGTTKRDDGAEGNLFEREFDVVDLADDLWNQVG